MITGAVELRDVGNDNDGPRDQATLAGLGALNGFVADNHVQRARQSARRDGLRVFLDAQTLPVDKFALLHQ